MAKSNKYTWADLKKLIDKLEPAQLKQEIRWWGEERGGKIINVSKLKEDHTDIGDNWEPVSDYKGEKGWDDKPLDLYDGSSNILPKGTPIIYVD